MDFTMTDQPTAKLLPCPACGKVPELLEFDSFAFGTQWQIDCENVDCCITISSMCRHSAEDAIAAWNTRTPPAIRDEDRARALKAVEKWIKSLNYRKGDPEPHEYIDSEEVLYDHHETIRAALSDERAHQSPDAANGVRTPFTEGEPEKGLPGQHSGTEAVDFDKLRRKILQTTDRGHFEDRGWNDCIDYLAARYDFVRKK